MPRLYSIVLLLLFPVLQLVAQSTITTVAGTEWVFNGDGRPALNAPLGQVSSLTVDRAGNLVFSDADNAIVARLNADGTLTVLAGNGLEGFSGDGGPATSASLNYPQGVAFDSRGNLYIADTFNNRIRRVTPDGLISTIAGTGQPDYTGDRGPALRASLRDPLAIAIDSSDTIYFSDGSDAAADGPTVVRRITNDGIITTIAGTGLYGFSGDTGLATQARLNNVVDIAFDASGNLYVVDYGNNRIRRVDTKGIITTVVGGSQPGYSGDGKPALQASIDGPAGIAVDNTGNIFFSDLQNFVVRKIDTQGIITTIAGNGDYGYSGDNSPAKNASFRAIFGIAVDSANNLYLADSNNSRIRKVNGNGIVSTIAGNGNFRVFSDDSAASNAFLFHPFGITADARGTLYIADSSNNRVRKITPAGTISTIAGNGRYEYSGDQGFATEAGLAEPNSAAPDRAGNVYIADTGNDVIRKIAPNGRVSTVAGNGTSDKDGILATQALLAHPLQAIVGPDDSLYIADTLHHRIRRVGADGTISTVAGNGKAGFAPAGDIGLAISASLNAPAGIAFDTAGNLYIADLFNARIRKVTVGGTISTVAGGGSRTVGANDSFSAMQAKLGAPYGVVADSSGNVFFSDNFLNRVFKVSAISGNISVVAGNGTAAFTGDGGPSAQAALNSPIGLAFDSTGSLLIADYKNNRIRGILSAAPSLKLSPAALSFSAKSGGGLTDAQNVSISSSISGLLYGLDIRTTTGGNWLKANLTGGSIPATVQTLADPSGLDPGTYRGSIVVTAPGATPSTTNVDVSLTVTAPDPPVLAPGSLSMSFTMLQGTAPATQTLSVANQGGGTLLFSATTSTETGGNWLTVSAATGSATAVTPASLTVQADVTGLDPGTYTGAVTIAGGTAGSRKLTVILTVNAVQRKLLLSQTGLRFTVAVGGGAPLAQNFAVLNAGQGDLPWTVQSVTLGGGSGWLTVTPTSGTSTAGAANVPVVNVAVNGATLDPGEYYGRIQIFSPTADNSPQTVSVVIAVLPAGSDPGPEVSPTGLVFTGAPGTSPGSQNVFVSNLTNHPITYSSSRTTQDGAAWFLNAPTNATVLPNQPARIVVQPDFTSLTAGTYSGTLQLVFDGGVTRTVNILSFVGGGATASSLSALQPRASNAASCNDKLVVNLISPQINFNMTATQPQLIQASVFDSCNAPMTSGMVNLRAKTGDKTDDKPMVSRGNGVWETTWQPSIANPPTVSMYVYAARALPGGATVGGQTAVISGTMKAGGTTPLVSNAVLNGASFVSQPLVAPGVLISIFGQQMADPQWPGACQPSPVPPLATQLGGAQLFLDNSPLALLYACDGQVNAQIPYDIATNARHQLWLQRDSTQSTAQSIPVDVSVAPTQPAVFTVSQNGQGQGDIFRIAPDGTQSQAPADPSAPVTAGDTVVIICSGLGVVTPQVPTGAPAPGDPTAQTVNAVSVTIGGVAAQVLRAELIPNASGVYQVKVVVPPGVTPGDQVPVVLTSGGQSSPTVTMAVK